MKAVPRRLLVLGGGRAGVELAQVVRRFGGEVALVETAERVLAREQAPLGEALGEALCRDGIELFMRVQATAARRDGQDYFLELDDGRELRGDRLPVAGGRRPRVAGIGLETVGIEADGDGIPVDPHLRAGGVQDLHARIRGVQRVPHPAQRRQAAERRLRARSRGRRVAAAGHHGHPRPRAARGAAGHRPALPRRGAAEDLMEFLVEFELNVPEGAPESEVRRRDDAEASATARLADEAISPWPGSSLWQAARSGPAACTAPTAKPGSTPAPRGDEPSEPRS